MPEENIIAHNPRHSMPFFVKNITTLFLLIGTLLILTCPVSAQDTKPAPDFTLPSLEGPALSLKDFKGQYLLVNFWATWCGPCKIEMPSLEYLHKKFKSRNLTVLGISNDMFGATVVKPYVEANDLTFPVLLDPRLDVSQRYKVVNLPSTFLIDPKGNIIGELFGAENWADPGTIQYFEDLLKTAPPAPQPAPTPAPTNPAVKTKG